MKLLITIIIIILYAVFGFMSCGGEPPEEEPPPRVVVVKTEEPCRGPAGKHAVTIELVKCFCSPIAATSVVCPYFADAPGEADFGKDGLECGEHVDPMWSDTSSDGCTTNNIRRTIVTDNMVIGELDTILTCGEVQCAISSRYEMRQ